MPSYLRVRGLNELLAEHDFARRLLVKIFKDVRVPREAKENAEDLPVQSLHPAMDFNGRVGKSGELGATQS